MSSYLVESQDDWDRITRDDNVTFSDPIVVVGDIDAHVRGGRELSIILRGSARVTAPSSTGSWYTIQSGALTLRWDGEDGAAVQADEDGGYATVTLIGYPSDIEPYVSAASTAGVRFKRVGSCDDTQAVDNPAHYTYVGDALARLGFTDVRRIESWDILDAVFPDSPLLWNAGKYLMRLGRKGDSSRRIVDLRKARAYLDRAIAREEGRGAK